METDKEILNTNVQRLDKHLNRELKRVNSILEDNRDFDNYIACRFINIKNYIEDALVEIDRVKE